MYKQEPILTLKTVKTKKRYYVYAGFESMAQAMAVILDDPSDARLDVHFMNYCLGYSGHGSESCDVIEFSPLKFKTVTKHVLKTILRKRA